MNEGEKTLKSVRVYSGKIINLSVDNVLCPNGVEATRELVSHNGASAVLLFDEEGKIVLESQWRYPFKEVLLEIPAGKKEENEDPKLTAIREVQEETGYIVDDIEFLGTCYPTVAYSNEVIYLYVAKAKGRGETHFDADESLTVSSYSIDEVKELVASNKIKDGKTLAAFSFYLAKQK